MHIAKEIVLGVDPSTVSTGWSIFKSGKLVEYGEIKCPSSWTSTRKVKHMYDGLKEVIEKHKPTVVACEDQYMGRANAVKSVSKIRGIVELLVEQYAIKEFHPFEPTRIKKSFTGKGNASKDAMIEQARNVFKSKIPRNKTLTDNMADAIAIGDAYYKLGGK